MRKIIYLGLSLLLLACNSDDTTTETDTSQTEATSGQDRNTANQSVAAEHSEHKHDNVHSKADGAFSPLIDLPYDVVESDEACEEPIVIEFFAYQCPHCYTLEKHAAEWKAKNQNRVKFMAIPTHLGHQEFGAFLIVHQAALNLGLLDKAMPAMFTRLHDEKKAFTSQEDAINFLVSLGADAEKAKSILENESLIKTGIDEGFKLLSKYKIAGVPTILVNHKYQFSVTKAGGYDKVFDIVDETLKLPSNCNK